MSSCWARFSGFLVCSLLDPWPFMVMIGVEDGGAER